MKVCEYTLFGLYIIQTKPSFSRSIWCLSFSIFYSSCIAIAQIYLQHSIGGLLWLLGERTFTISTPGIARISILPFAFSHQTQEVLRPYATFPHPNVLGGFLAVSLPLLITYWKSSTLNMKKIIMAYVYTTVLLGYLTIILTFSRSAWLVGIIGLCCAYYTNMKYRIKKTSALVAVGVAIIAYIFALPYFQTLTPNNESVYVRKELNTSALMMLHPTSGSLVSSQLFGVGLGNFLVELPHYYPRRDIFFLQPVHNIYLLLLSETGIVGLILFMFGIGYLFLKNKKGSQFSLSIFHYSLFMILMLGIVDHYPITIQQGQLLFTILISFAYASNMYISSALPKQNTRIF
jgi:O-antigen ligase